jgi:hypothetical protein
MKKREPFVALINIFQDRFLNTIEMRVRFSSIFKVFLKIVTGNPVGTSDAEILSWGKTLESDGLCLLPTLSGAKCKIIEDFSSQAKLYDPWQSDGSVFDLDTVPAGTRVARVVSPIDCDTVAALVYDRKILELMRTQFGSKFVIDAVDVWWSFPSDEDAFEAENFHRDTDALEFYKYFIYITNVDRSTGPHTLIKGSHKTSDFFSHERFSDDEIFSAYPDREVMVGSKGTSFVANTVGLHKGQKPTNGKRLLLQVRYSLHGSSFRYRGSKHNVNYQWVKDYAYKDYLAQP